jgi:WD40 repeat protein
MTINAPGFRLRSAYDVAFSPSGELLVTVGQKKQVKLWSLQHRRQIAVNTLLKHPAYVALSPNGSSYAVKNTIGEIVVCSTASGALVSRYNPSEPTEGCPVVFTADSQFLIDGSWDGRIEVRSLSNLQRVWTQLVGYMVIDVSASFDRTLWAFTIKDTPDHVLLRRWPFDRRKRVRRLEIRSPSCARVSPDGTRLAVIHEWHGTLSVFDLKANDIVATFTQKNIGTHSELAWSPDGRLLGTTQDGQWKVYSADRLCEIGSLPGPFPCAIEFSPDGSLLALGSWERGLVVPLAQMLVQ